MFTAFWKELFQYMKMGERKDVSVPQMLAKQGEKRV